MNTKAIEAYLQDKSRKYFPLSRVEVTPLASSGQSYFIHLYLSNESITLPKFRGPYPLDCMLTITKLADDDIKVKINSTHFKLKKDNRLQNKVLVPCRLKDINEEADLLEMWETYVKDIYLGILQRKDAIEGFNEEWLAPLKEINK